MKGAKLKTERKVEMKLLTTGISPQYVRGWDVEKAIREIVQNDLDSRKEFDCDGYISWDRETGVATVKDNGPGLLLRHLALGVSEKGDGAIGKYGEGLKLALLVMAREGRDIEVRASGKIIRPAIEAHEGFGTEILVMHVEDMPPHHAALHTGTTVRFECSQAELEAGKSYFERYLSARNGFRWVESGKISKPAGHVYINGARVGNIDNAMFSYHLDEARVGDIGNRDREVIDQNQVRPHIRRMLAETSSMEVMRGLISSVAYEGHDSWEMEAGIEFYSIPENSRRVWKRALNEVLGESVVLSSGPDHNREAMYRGHHIIHVSWVWKEAFRHMGMLTAEDVVRERTTIRRIAVQRLDPEERKVLNRAKRLVEKHYNKIGRLTVAENLEYKTGDARIRGMYDFEEDRIYIKREVLQNIHDAVHVLLHEAVHKHSGELDCTAGFERALTDVAVEMMLQ